jgi:hypothetical protein
LLRAHLGRCERAGFAHGDLVRETMSTCHPGHGYPFPPVKRIRPADRAAIIAALALAGMVAHLERSRDGWRVVIEPGTAVLWYTTAPEAYDYHYVHTVRVLDDPVLRDKHWRLIRVTDATRFAACQRPRYSSGLHPALRATDAERCAVLGLPVLDGGAP